MCVAITKLNNLFTKKSEEFKSAIFTFTCTFDSHLSCDKWFNANNLFVDYAIELWQTSLAQHTRNRECNHYKQRETLRKAPDDSWKLLKRQEADKFKPSSNDLFMEIVQMAWRAHMIIFYRKFIQMKFLFCSYSSYFLYALLSLIKKCVLSPCGTLREVFIVRRD